MTALEAASYKIKPYSLSFDRPDLDDVEWLPVVGSKKWYVISRDKGIKRRPLEQKAIIDNRLGWFVLSGTGAQGVEGWNRIMKRAKRNIYKFLRSHRRPFIASVLADGRVTDVSPSEVAKAKPPLKRRRR